MCRNEFQNFDTGIRFKWAYRDIDRSQEIELSSLRNSLEWELKSLRNVPIQDLLPVVLVLSSLLFPTPYRSANKERWIYGARYWSKSHLSFFSLTQLVRCTAWSVEKNKRQTKLFYGFSLRGPKFFLASWYLRTHARTTNSRYKQVTHFFESCTITRYRGSRFKHGLRAMRNVSVIWGNTQSV